MSDESSSVEAKAASVSDEDDDDVMKIGIVIGAAVAALLVIVIVIVVVACILKRDKDNEITEDAQKGIACSSVHDNPTYGSPTSDAVGGAATAEDYDAIPDNALQPPAAFSHEYETLGNNDKAAANNWSAPDPYEKLKE